MPELPSGAAAALINALDGLSRGLNHALSNRVNTLNTLLAVLQETPVHDAEVIEALASEEARFEALLALYRVMPLELSAAPEPILLADPVNVALALFHHHLDLRMLPCDVTGLDSTAPVRCPRQSLTQAILVMLVAVGRPMVGDDGGHGLSLVAGSTDDEAVLRATTTRPAPAVDESAWVAFEWLASVVGATARRGVDDDGRPWAALVMPTLAALRRKGR
jgi:hypothetical protein